MAKQRVTIKKHEGNDLYSWAVFLDGEPLGDLTGLNRTSAQYYRDRVRAQIAAKPIK